MSSRISATRRRAEVEREARGTMRARLATMWRGIASFSAGIAGEFRAPERPWPRALDEAETVASVLLAILLAHLLRAENVGWAAFSGYMVMRSSLAESSTRGSLRVLGTVAGAALACAVALLLGHSRLALSAALALVGGTTLHAALTRRRSYAWLFTGLTFCMVLLDAQAEPMRHVAHFASTRILEVTAGTLACLVINLLSHRTLRPKLGLPNAAPAVTPPARSQERGDAARHALQAALALAAVPWLTGWLDSGQLSQAAVTIMALMMVPLSSLRSNRHLVSVRVAHRLTGCIAGCLAAMAALLLCGGSVVAILFCMSLGVAAGRHVENSMKPFAYAGNQFVLVFLVVLVPDSYAALSAEPGLERVAGVIAGIVVLQAVRLLPRPFRHPPPT